MINQANVSECVCLHHISASIIRNSRHVIHPRQLSASFVRVRLCPTVRVEFVVRAGFARQLSASFIRVNLSASIIRVIHLYQFIRVIHPRHLSVSTYPRHSSASFIRVNLSA